MALQDAREVADSLGIAYTDATTLDELTTQIKAYWTDYENLEKNKEENVPYLNPEYVEYLDYINGNLLDESIIYDVIPDETIVDYDWECNYG